MKIAIPEKKVYNYILLIYEDLGSPKAIFLKDLSVSFTQKNNKYYTFWDIFSAKHVPKRIIFPPAAG